MSWVRTRLTFSNVIAFVALFALLGGGAYAASKVGSKDIKKNAVRSKHIKNKQVKSADLAGNTKAMWAVVTANGSIERQSGGITADPTGNGQYEVVFPNAVRNKRALVATSRETGVATFVGARRDPSGVPDPKKAIVTTRDVSGTLTNRTFTIAAIP